MKWAILFFVPLVAADHRPAGTPAEDLAQVQAEPRPEKRAHEALDNADNALRLAREAYGKGDLEGTRARLYEVARSVELTDSSLTQTGKKPSRSPKHFKYAELRTRELLRKLEGFREEMSVADRPELERVMTTVQKIHDAWLDGIMGKNK